MNLGPAGGFGMPATGFSYFVCIFPTTRVYQIVISLSQKFINKAKELKSKFEILSCFQWYGTITTMICVKTHSKFLCHYWCKKCSFYLEHLIVTSHSVVGEAER